MLPLWSKLLAIWFAAALALAAASPHDGHLKEFLEGFNKFIEQKDAGDHNHHHHHHHEEADHEKYVEAEPIGREGLAGQVIPVAQAWLAVAEAEEYDFIIVGAGTSGSLLANRLSQVPEWKVLLLEAGQEPDIYSKIPALFRHLFHTNMTWDYRTEPEENACLNEKEHRCEWLMGKALGGTSAINGLIYSRGNKHDYDTWADGDNAEWCYSDVLPYFKRTEDSFLEQFDANHHSRGGELRVENNRFASPLKKAFLAAAEEAGLKLVDYNGRSQLGTGATQTTAREGQRWGAYDAFLEPIKERKNLKVVQGAVVVRAVVGEHTKQASGVTFEHEGELHLAKARKEVVLSAGPLNTPAILMRSGIGAKAHLQKLHIPVLADLPVGAAVIDHYGFHGVPYTLAKPEGVKKADLVSEKSAEKWFNHGDGPLASNGIETVSFVSTSNRSREDGVPDVELLMLDHNAYHRDEDGFTVLPILLHPKSVGSLQLRSPSPWHQPVLRANYFSDEADHDLKTLLAGVRKAQQIAASPALQHLGAQLDRRPVQGCEKALFDSDAYWQCALKHETMSFSHYMATCRMGPKTDKGAVVDRALNVYGVHGLRVVDTSVIPVAISSHNVAVGYMIAEKAADIIKKQWKS